MLGKYKKNVKNEKKKLCKKNAKQMYFDGMNMILGLPS